jgi:hypothetical protein
LSKESASKMRLPARKCIMRSSARYEQSANAVRFMLNEKSMEQLTKVGFVVPDDRALSDKSSMAS